VYLCKRTLLFLAHGCLKQAFLCVGATDSAARPYCPIRLSRRRTLFLHGRTPLGVFLRNRNTLSCATLGGTRLVGVNPEPK